MPPLIDNNPRHPRIVVGLDHADDGEHIWREHGFARGESVKAIRSLFDRYLDDDDFVGADLARKFLQMGFTRARRYANHRGGRKYAPSGEELPRSVEDEVKAGSAQLFFTAWKEAEAEPRYASRKRAWKQERG